MPGIMHDDVEAAVVSDDFADRRIDGFLRANVEFDGPKGDAFILGVLIRRRE
jgi:hypothetical protein